MSDRETRYSRTKRIEESKARHARNVGRLAEPTETRWERAMEELQPPCVKAGLPSRWTDWDSDPERREDYETDIPTLEEAKAMCAECPIRAVQYGGNGLCLDYANATGQSHGNWGGVRREDGKWLNEKAEHTTKAT